MKYAAKPQKIVIDANLWKSHEMCENSGQVDQFLKFKYTNLFGMPYTSLAANERVMNCGIIVIIIGHDCESA